MLNLSRYNIVSTSRKNLKQQQNKPQPTSSQPPPRPSHNRRRRGNFFVLVFLLLLSLNVITFFHVINSETLNAFQCTDSGQRSKPLVKENIPFKSSTVGFFFRPPVQACKNRTIKVLFLGCEKENWGSMLMRGVVISKLLRAPEYPDFDSIFTKDCKNRTLFQNADYCVFIKGFPQRDVVAQCREMKAKVIWDLVDYSTWWNVTKYIQRMDYIMASTTYQKHEILKLKGVRTHMVWIIPHHHDNSERLLPPYNTSKPVRTIGTHGGTGNTLSNAQLSVLNKFCLDRKIDFEYLSYKPTATSFEAMEAYTDRFYTQLSTLDIALILPPEQVENDHLSLFFAKPATRALVTMSMGIPTIMYPYISYLELSQIYKNPLYATTVDEVTKLLQFLIDHPDARRFHSEEGLRTAAMFTKESAVSLYAYHLRAALGTTCHPEPTT